MKKALYIDCASGITGNMIMGALLELVEDRDWFLNEMSSLHLDVDIQIEEAVRNGISGTYVNIIAQDCPSCTPDHAKEIIDLSNIDPKAKGLAKRIIDRLVKAESKVRHCTLEDVTFDRCGAFPAITSIIGTSVLLTKLHPDLIYSSIVNDGYGFVEDIDGTVPVPVPTTSEIFADSHVISRQIAVNTELVTPTGAAIIAEIGTSFDVMPAMDVEKIGWGCGNLNLKIPHILKISMGEIIRHPDEMLVFETTVESTTTEILGYVMKALKDAHAYEAYYTPGYTPDPIVHITVMARDTVKEAIIKILEDNFTILRMSFHRESLIPYTKTFDKVRTTYRD